MKVSKEFLNLILDSVTEHIVVIDKAGKIKYVNKSWEKFAKNNGCSINMDWSGVNYLTVCGQSTAIDDDFCIIDEAGDGIRRVINKETDLFYYEYPCHSPIEKRWFMMRVTPFTIGGQNYFVISHQNITQRKLAEEEVINHSKMDGLTKIPNRRTFDEFFDEEWRRCLRLNMPISLAIVDLDHFKFLNDTYGHLSGDECLKKVGELLKEFSKRPSDICARYGGEEFALIWGNTSLDKAESLAKKLLKKISEFNIENKNSPVKPYVTASIGVSEMMPETGRNTNDLIDKADKNLYRAKKTGRNRVVA